MKILITGATGFIGLKLIKELSKKGNEIRCLVRKSSDVSELKKYRGVTFIYGDITKKKSIINIADGIELVFHLAVLGHFKDGRFKDYIRVNVEGLRNILKECRKSKVQRIVYTTTSATLGLVKNGNVSEEETGIPINDYGKSKLLAEATIRKYIVLKTPIVMVLLTHVYGPGEVRDLYKIIKLMKIGIFPQIGIGENLYPAVYIDDAVSGLILAGKRGRVGEKYIVTDKTSHNLKDIRKIVYSYFKKKLIWYPLFPTKITIALVFVLEKTLNIFRLKVPFSSNNLKSITSGRQFSIEKAERELGYRPKVTLKKGIIKCLDYYVLNKLL